MIKRILLTIALTLGIATSAYAGMETLVAVDTTGAGKTLEVRYVPDVHILECHYTDANASISALVVDLEGSLDKTYWYQLSQHTFTAGELTAKQAAFFTINAPVRYVRGNITTLTGADVGTDEITCTYDFHREEN